MTALVNPRYSPQDLEAAHRNCNILIEFLIDSNGLGKYNMSLSRVQGLFDSTWRNIPTSSGHMKKQHKITGAVVVYKNHDNDPVDPGAIVTIRGIVQDHINRFYEQFLGYSTRVKRQRVPDFSKIATHLNQKKGPV
jgi:hypothetical protein